LYEYWTAQKWKRSEFAARQFEMLTTDPVLAMCCQFLDWSYRRMPIPERYKIYSGEDDSFVHKWATLETSMRPESEQDSFPFPQVLYRDYFDHFFAYLERINHYLDIGLFSKKDVSSLKYWLEQVAEPRYVQEDKQYAFFRDFLEKYGYSGVLELMHRFRVGTE